MEIEKDSLSSCWVLSEYMVGDYELGLQDWRIDAISKFAAKFCSCFVRKVQKSIYFRILNFKRSILELYFSGFNRNLSLFKVYKRISELIIFLELKFWSHFLKFGVLAEITQLPIDLLVFTWQCLLLIIV